MLAVEIAVVVILVLVNGALALSELAVVSARRSRLQMQADQGHAGAAAALALAANPGRFLSTVQIGITLVGVLAGAFSGTAFADRLGDHLETYGLSHRVADGVAFGVVVAAITYLSLVAGELVPKQIALRNPEGIAVVVARPLLLLAKLAAPAVFLLDLSSRLCLWILGSERSPEQAVTEEEIKMLVAEATDAGVVEQAEKEMIAGVMRLGDRPVRAIMTPRHEVDWIDLDADPEEIRRKIRASQHTTLPAGHGSVDAVSGVIRTRDLLDAYLDDRPVDPKSLLRPAPAVPDTADALDVIKILKREKIQLAIVVDEYGSFEGVVSTDDILETIAGEFSEDRHEARPDARQREDGSWLVDGAFAIDELAERLQMPLPGERDYHTVAGFVLAELRRLPNEGDRLVWAGWRLEVIDMDGRRIDKVLASREAG